VVVAVAKVLTRLEQAVNLLSKQRKDEEVYICVYLFLSVCINAAVFIN
jgi:hypothetical protein